MILTKLKDVSSHPFATQKGVLLEALAQHQGKQDQRDDITFLGIKL